MAGDLSVALEHTRRACNSARPTLERGSVLGAIERSCTSRRALVALARSFGETVAEVQECMLRIDDFTEFSYGIGMAVT